MGVHERGRCVTRTVARVAELATLTQRCGASCNQGRGPMRAGEGEVPRTSHIQSEQSRHCASESCQRPQARSRSRLPRLARASTGRLLRVPARSAHCCARTAPPHARGRGRQVSTASPFAATRHTQGVWELFRHCSTAKRRARPRSSDWHIHSPEPTPTLAGRAGPQVECRRGGGRPRGGHCRLIVAPVAGHEGASGFA